MVTIGPRKWIEDTTAALGMASLEPVFGGVEELRQRALGLVPPMPSVPSVRSSLPSLQTLLAPTAQEQAPQQPVAPELKAPEPQGFLAGIPGLDALMSLGQSPQPPFPETTASPVAAQPQGAEAPAQSPTIARPQAPVGTPAAMPQGQPTQGAPVIAGKDPENQGKVYQQARASGLDDEGARILAAISETEGGTRGAVGDQGRSRGVYQFHEQGEMPGFRSWLAQQGIQGDPNQLAVDPAISTRYAAEGYLGRAIAEGRKQGLSGSALATYVQQTGQRSDAPETTGANYERLFGSGRPVGPQPTTPPQAEQTPAAQGQAFAAGSYTPNQINAATAEGLDYETALAVCGPAAAIAFARKHGRNPSMQEAVRLAKDVGWTVGAGMAGPASQQKLLQSLGVAARLVDGAPDWQSVAADVQRGNPVIVSTPGHYFVAERYNPQDGTFDFGNSAAVLKASNGRRWFRPEEIASLGMGEARATLFMDSPESPSPSVVAGRSTPNAGAAQPSAPAASPSAPPTTGRSQVAPAGGSGGDTVTIEHIDNGRRMTVPRANLPGYMQSPAPGVPPMWREVSGGAEQDMQRLSLGGEPVQQSGYGEPLPAPMPGNRAGEAERNPPLLPGARLLPGERRDDPSSQGQGWLDRKAENSMYRMPLSPTDPEAYDPDSGPREWRPEWGTPGLGVSERDPVGYQSPALRRPVDYRDLGERPYDATDDEGVDRSNEDRFVVPRPGPYNRSPYGVGDTPVDTEVIPSPQQFYRAPLYPTDPEVSMGAAYDPDSGPRESGYTVPVAGDQPPPLTGMPGEDGQSPVSFDPDAGPREATPGSVGAGPVGELYGPEPVAEAPLVTPGYAPRTQWPGGQPRVAPPDEEILAGQGPVARGIDALDTAIRSPGVQETAAGFAAVPGPIGGVARLAQDYERGSRQPLVTTQPGDADLFMGPQPASPTALGLNPANIMSEQDTWRSRVASGAADAIARGIGDDPDRVLIGVEIGGVPIQMTVSELLENATDPLLAAGFGVGDMVLDAAGKAALRLVAPYVRGGVRATIGRLLTSDPVQGAVAAGREMVGEGIEAARGFPARVSDALETNARNVAAADARMAAEGSTVAPGTLGIAMGTDAQSMVRPRVVPPDVADTLDFPIRIPEDPSVLRAIEAAGGSVDPQRGVDLNVIRYQGPEAHGQTATRGAPFYTAGPPGSRSEYATNTNSTTGVGGTERIEGRTRFRSPLVISDAPGTSRGFDEGMAQLRDPRALEEAQQAFDRTVQEYEAIVQRRGGNLDTLRAARAAAGTPGGFEVYDRSGTLIHTAESHDAARAWARANGTPTADIVQAAGARSPEWIEADAALQEVVQGRHRLEEAHRALKQIKRPVTEEEVERGIRQARSAGPEGSPERAQALKDLVTRYGGDPNLIDDLLAIRGADASESAWAIKENILAHQARAKGYDGVITVQHTQPDFTVLSMHPAVKAATAEESAAFDELYAARDAYHEWREKNPIRPPGEPQPPYEEEFRVTGRVSKAQERLEAAQKAVFEAEQAAKKELGGSKITELMDPREARNPTPGAPNPIYERTKKRLEEQLAQAKRDYERVAYNAYAPGHAITQDEANAMLEAMRRQGEAEGGLNVLKDSNKYDGPPGYTLRSDIPVRPDAPEVRTSTIAENPRLIEAERAYEAAEARSIAAQQAFEQAEAAHQAKPHSANWKAYQRADKELTEARAAWNEARTALDAASDQGRYVTANATAGALPASGRTADPLSAVNRVLGQGVASSVSGGVGAVVNQEMNPDDPNAAIKGFAVGALGPVLGANAVRKLVGRRGAGLTDEALATFGNVPNTPQGTQIVRRLGRQTQQSTPPNLLEIAQTYRHSFGLLGNVGTGLLNAIGGPVETALGLPTEAIRMGIMKGYPVPVVYQAGSIVAALKDAAVAAAGTAVGKIPQSVRAAPDFRPPMAERMQGSVGKAAGYVLDTPGRLATQTPDAFWGTVFDRWGRSREASNILAENGVSRLDPAAQVQELNRLLTNPTADEAQRIADGARKFAEEMTYKGPAGFWEQTLSKPFRPGGKTTTSADPAAAQVHDLVGSLLMPFYGSIFKIHKRGSSFVPVLGSGLNRSMPSDEKISRQLVGLGLGIWAADRAAQGLVTGPGPTDPDEKERLRASGWDEWSTYVPGVGYVKSDNLGSAGPYLKAIGGYYDVKRYATPQEKADPGKMTDATIKNTLVRPFESFPVVQAMQALISMAESPVKGGADLLTSVGSSFVPAVVRSAEAAKDPYQRRVDPNAPMLEQAEQRAINRVGSIPGLGSRQDLPPALDRKGEPVPNPRAGIGAFIPQPKQQQPEDPIITEMGTYGVNLDKARDRFAFTRAGADAPDGAPGSVRVILSPDEQQQWLRYRWQKIQEAAPTVQADPRYTRGVDGQRKRAWENVISAAEQYADRALKAGIGRPVLEQRIREAPAAEPVRRAS